MKGKSVSELSDPIPLTHYIPKGTSLDVLDRMTIISKNDRWDFPSLSKKFVLFNPNMGPEVKPGFAKSADGSKVSIVFLCADAGLASVCGLLVTKSKVKPVFFAWVDKPVDAQAIADRIIKRGK